MPSVHPVTASAATHNATTAAQPRSGAGVANMALDADTVTTTATQSTPAVQASDLKATDQKPVRDSNKPTSNELAQKAADTAQNGSHAALQQAPELPPTGYGKPASSQPASLSLLG